MSIHLDYLKRAMSYWMRLVHANQDQKGSQANGISAAGDQLVFTYLELMAPAFSEESAGVGYILPEWPSRNSANPHHGIGSLSNK